jgi:putative colanic acid biosynthesis acetyltransferase WcaF
MTADFRVYKYVDTLSRGERAKRLVWNFVWAVAFRPTPRWALHGWRRYLLRLFGARIGTGCKIAPSAFVWAPWNLEMGQFSALGSGVDCYSMNRITIGSNVAVSQRVFLCTGSHDTRSLRRPLTTKPIVIGDHVWIAAECFVHPGVTIGEGAVIGARAVVATDMPPWMICAGHPCAPIKERVIDSEA